MPAFANGVDRRLIAEHDGDKGQGPQRSDVRSPVRTRRRPGHRAQKASWPTPMTTPAIVRLPMRQAFGVGDGRTLSVVNDIAEEVAGDHDDDHQQRRQDRVPGHDQADDQEEHRARSS